MNKSNMLSGRYKILEQVGIGGMSYVYKARDTKKRKDVAIKVLREELSQDKDLLKRFKDEASASKKIKHNNVVAVYDMVDEGDLHYIVMEYLDGPTLTKYIQIKGHLSNEETVKISLDIAKGLEAAHKEGIIHRDIKPQNVVIMKDGVAKITDFGIARAISSTTQNLSVVGTVHYISPEQANNSYIDFRSDIYSLGCAMYEMITGKVPFEGDTPVNIIVSHLRNGLKKPSLNNKDIYPSLEKVIMKCSRILPMERYQNATSLIEDLNKVLDDKNGSFIKENVYDDTEGKTMIISDEQMKLIKNLSTKYTNARTNQHNIESKDQKEFYNKYIQPNNSSLSIKIMIAVITCLIVAVIILFILFNKKPKVQIENVVKIATVSEIVNPTTFDIVGLDVEVANIVLKDANIVIDIDGYEYNDDYDNGKIIRYREVEEGDLNIYKVILSKGPEILDFSNIEKLNNTRFTDLVPQLEERNLIYSTVESNDKKVDKGYIIGCNKINSSEKGELIFTISKGLSENMRIMPDLTGKTIEEAKEILYNSELVLGKIGKRPDSFIKENQIVLQSVSKGNEVEKGSVIDITLTSGLNGDYIDVSNVGEYIGRIKTTYVVHRGVSPTINENSSQFLYIYVRLKQNTKNGIIYKELLQPAKYKVGTTISLSFDSIQGEKDVYGGVLEVVDCINDEILATYNVYFREVT